MPHRVELLTAVRNRYFTVYSVVDVVQCIFINTLYSTYVFDLVMSVVFSPFHPCSVIATNTHCVEIADIQCGTKSLCRVFYNLLQTQNRKISQRIYLVQQILIKMIILICSYWLQ